MFAAIPYFELRTYNLDLPVIGQLPLDPWAILVLIGFVVGLEVARARAIRLGLDTRDVVDGAVFIVLSGFLGAHLFTVLFYNPELLLEDGIFAFGGFSSFGGFLGAIGGTILFYKVIRKRSFWRHADVIAFGFPFGWFFGRMGCGVVHDHIGRKTNFPLAMDFDRGWFTEGNPNPWVDGVRHELGLYEAAFTLVIVATFLYLGRRDRAPGFFAGMFAVIYAPVRFMLDFLRNTDLGTMADARYLGLTPGQYGAVAMLVAGIIILKTRDRSFEPHPLDGSPAGGDDPRPASGQAD